jgi:hypothetical protein
MEEDDAKIRAEGKTPEYPLDSPFGMYKYYCEKRDTCWYDGRNYNLFAILANVRNGSGFAGIETGKGYNPISLPKGLPSDLSYELRQDDDMCDEEGEMKPGRYSFGYHDFSWLTVKELIDYNWNQEVKNCGIIGWDAYKERIANGETGSPESYCGGISGPDIVVIDEEEAVECHLRENISKKYKDKKVNVKIWWTEKYHESASIFYTKVLPALQKIDPNPENVRIVFGFDS